MQYIEAPNTVEFEHKQQLFLGGGISNCPDWQSQVVEGLKDLNITLINPRRVNFNVANPNESKIQIEWEHNYLNKASQLMFWFPKETVCPITLFELGAALERWRWCCGRQTIFIGCHPEYSRLFDVQYQTEIIQLSRKVKTSLDEVISDIQLWYKNLPKNIK